MTAATTPVPSPEVLDYLEKQAAPPAIWELDIAALREYARIQQLETAGRAEPVRSVEPVDAGGVKARLYHPAGHASGALVWLHGGGWMLGDLDGCDPLARMLANRAGCAVLTVGYRLAPEHPFPAAIEDTWAALRWASMRFESVAVGGDSAGGNLAAVAARRARDAALPLALQLLVYPVVTSDVDAAAYRGFAERYRTFAGRKDFGRNSQEGIRYLWGVYVPDPDLRSHPDVAPLRAASLRDLAPTLLIGAEHDILCNEGQEYARRLSEDGVTVEMREYAGQIHGFFTMLGVMKDAHRAVEVAAEALRRVLQGQAEPR